MARKDCTRFAQISPPSARSSAAVSPLARLVATKRANGETAADDLAEGGEIWANLVQSLRATNMHSKSGHDLVKN